MRKALRPRLFPIRSRSSRTCPLPAVAVLGVVAVVVRVDASTAGDVWGAFAASAAREHGDAGRRAAAFLAEHRPPRDEEIDLGLLEENLRLALEARQSFPWAQAVPEAIFHNDVLPYAVLDETRESWRGDFHERSRRIVANCTTAAEAAQALNRDLFNDIAVHYNTGRKRPNQSPSESIAQGRATCTGLSIILVDACRAVGIPARVAGVASWHDKRGNHTWVEIWDGTWQFTGADEYQAAGLNRGWFVGDAAKAKAGDPEHAVWATSWRTTGAHFPMVWSAEDTSVPAVDVTATYVRTPEDAAAGATLYVRLWNARSGSRLEAAIEAVAADGAVVATGRTRAGTADLNDMPELRIAPGEPVTLRVQSGPHTRTATVPGPAAGATTLDLYWNELALTEDEAESLVHRLWTEHAERIRTARAEELEAKVVTADDHTLRYLERSFGAAPDGARSLWISMHGGGGAPTEVNDRQWQNQIKLYEPAEGIYVAPRAPTDSWNLWHQAHVDALLDRLIETFVAARGVDPDRVYLMGYSAGGDGVYQLAPRMADRFAAASMMAGHPNEAQPTGLRNLPFAIFMGGDDDAYNRAAVARGWGERLEQLRAADPDGYPHRVTIYEGLGHWMNRRDAEAVPWMAEHERQAWPQRVAWLQDDVTHERFYWLSVPAGAARAGTTVDARVEGRTITVVTEDVSAVTLRLRDTLLDLDEPIEVHVNGAVAFSGTVPRTEAAIAASLAERNDPELAATAELRLAW